MQYLRRPATFSNNTATDLSFGGVPLAEAVLEMEVGNCVVCGRDPHEAGGGALDDVTINDGVMRGNSTCLDCLKEAGDPVAKEIENGT